MKCILIVVFSVLLLQSVYSVDSPADQIYVPVALKFIPPQGKEVDSLKLYALTKFIVLNGSGISEISLSRASGEGPIRSLTVSDPEDEITFSIPPGNYTLDSVYFRTIALDVPPIKFAELNADVRIDEDSFTMIDNWVQQSNDPYIKSARAIQEIKAAARQVQISSITPASPTTQFELSIYFYYSADEKQLTGAQLNFLEQSIKVSFKDGSGEQNRRSVISLSDSTIHYSIPVGNYKIESEYFDVFEVNIERSDEFPIKLKDGAIEQINSKITETSAAENPNAPATPETPAETPSATTPSSTFSGTASSCKPNVKSLTIKSVETIQLGHDSDARIVTLDNTPADNVAVQFANNETDSACIIHQYTVELWKSNPTGKDYCDDEKDCLRIQIASDGAKADGTPHNQPLDVPFEFISGLKVFYNNKSDQKLIDALKGGTGKVPEFVWLRVETCGGKTKEECEGKWNDSLSYKIKIIQKGAASQAEPLPEPGPLDLPEGGCKTIVECKAYIDREFVQGAFIKETVSSAGSGTSTGLCSVKIGAKNNPGIFAKCTEYIDFITSSLATNPELVSAGFDVPLTEALISTESDCDILADGRKNDKNNPYCGLMQLHCTDNSKRDCPTAKSRFGGDIDVFNAEQNIACGIEHLKGKYNLVKKSIDKYSVGQHSIPLTIFAYNRGETSAANAAKLISEGSNLHDAMYTGCLTSGASWASATMCGSGGEYTGTGSALGARYPEKILFYHKQACAAVGGVVT